MTTIRQEKNQHFCQVDYPEPECGVHLENPEYFAADLLHPFEGPHRPARAFLRRVSFLFRAIIALPIGSAPPQYFCLFQRHLPTLFDRDFIQRVRDAVSLPDLIGRDHRVEPQGREYKCICPFHNDTRPSLGIYERHGEWRYKCFSCGAGGDCFTYLMEYHKMSFVEAVRECADLAGIEVPATPGRQQEGPDRQTMLDVMQAAQDFFVQALASPDGTEARTTFVKRGYSEEAQRELGLGFAPEGWENLVPHLMGRGIPLNLLREMGLAKVRQQGDGAYDAFRNRLMFPIRDARGRVVAFGGRIVDPEDNPKYLNSPEHPLFFKGKLLYGFDVAAKPIENENLAIVCEGYTDALACHRFGFHHAVATLGTAMTSDHARLLERRTSRVLLLFDGDVAGIRAARRAVEITFKQNLDVTICVLPEGQDPDDVLREGGPDAFREQLDRAVDALEWLLSEFAKDADGADGDADRFRRTERFLLELANLGFHSMPALRQDFVLRRIGSILETDPETVKSMMPQPRAAAAVEDKPTSSLSPSSSTMTYASSPGGEMVEGPNGSEFEVFDIPPELLNEGQPVNKPSEALTQQTSGLTSSPADRRRRHAEENVLMALLAFAEVEPKSTWPEAVRGLKLQNHPLGDLAQRLLALDSGPRCSMVLDELRTQGEDDATLRHWQSQAEQMLRSEEPPRLLLERAIQDLHLVNERETNQRADSEAKRAAAAGDFSALDAIRHRRRMG